MDSGAIHLIGSRLTEAAHRKERDKKRLEKTEKTTPEVNLDATGTFIIFLFVDVARQAEVAELDALGRSHKDVSHRDVPACGEPGQTTKWGRKGKTKIHVFTPAVWHFGAVSE